MVLRGWCAWERRSGWNVFLEQLGVGVPACYFDDETCQLYGCDGACIVHEWGANFHVGMQCRLEVQVS